MSVNACGSRWLPLAILLAVSGCDSGQGDKAAAGSPVASPSAQRGTSPASANATVEADLGAEFDPARDPATDLRAATAAAKREGKRIVLDVGGDWCAWCQRLDAFVERDPGVRAFRDAHFVWMKVNYSEQNENIPFLSRYPQARGYPHLFVLDADGKLLHSQFTGSLEQGKGYDRDKFIAFLKKWAPASTRS